MGVTTGPRSRLRVDSGPVAPEMVPETVNFTTRDYKATVGRFASGVTVVTTRLGALRAGITVNAFCSLSLDPPLVLICIDRGSRVHDVLVQAGIFAANLLAADQEAVSRCFAGHASTRWEDFCGCATHVASTGAPIFDQSLGFVDCRIADVFPGGDHSIIVGRVEALGASAGAPLLYYRGRYDVPRQRSRSGGARSTRRAAAPRASESGEGTSASANGRSPGPAASNAMTDALADASVTPAAQRRARSGRTTPRGSQNGATRTSARGTSDRAAGRTGRGGRGTRPSTADTADRAPERSDA